MQDRTALTQRQAEVVRAIAAHLTKYRRPPSYARLAYALGVGPTEGVKCHLRPLERKGWIVRSRDRHVSISLAGCSVRACGKPALSFHDSPCGWRLADLLVGRIALAMEYRS